MWTIRQEGEKWEVLDGEGIVLATLATYGLALAVIAEAAAAVSAPKEQGAPDGALPERWHSGPDGIIGQFVTNELPDFRDFSACDYTWRDTPLPVMLQTTTEIGHFGAVLAGWIETIGLEGGRVTASGWFHDTEEGRKARDILTAQQRFGCSVDPGSVDAEFECIEEDEDEWGTFCAAGRVVFHAYEIAGFTLTPFPAFPQCYIELDAATSEEPPPALPAAEEPVAASASPASVRAMRVRPPRDWFTMPEPPEDDPRWVQQMDGQRGIPLTITDDGQVYGHAGLWGTCHIGRRACITPPESQAAYAHFHVGSVDTDQGPIPTGTFTAGCEHAALTLGLAAARDWYAHSGASFADLRASNGRAGVWIAGALRPDVTDAQVRVFRALAASGDWRRDGLGYLELVGVLAVNVPGFPVARETIVASGETFAPATAHVGYRTLDLVTPVALVAAGITLPSRDTLSTLVAAGTVDCAPCGERQAARRRRGEPSTANLADLRTMLAEVSAMVSKVELRTRHLRGDAVGALRQRIER